MALAKTACGWYSHASREYVAMETTEGETGPKRHIASQLDALGIAGNEETPIHRRARQNTGSRQAIREER